MGHTDISKKCLLSKSKCRRTFERSVFRNVSFLFRNFFVADVKLGEGDEDDEDDDDDDVDDDDNDDDDDMKPS